MSFTPPTPPPAGLSQQSLPSLSRGQSFESQVARQSPSPSQMPSHGFGSALATPQQPPSLAGPGGALRPGFAANNAKPPAMMPRPIASPPAPPGGPSAVQAQGRVPAQAPQPFKPSPGQLPGRGLSANFASGNTGTGAGFTGDGRRVY